jgi:hypothetical protein
MIHYLESDLFNQIVSLKNDNEKRGLAWRIILADDTLCPVLRRDRIDIYYRGFKIFSLSGNGISRNHEQFDNDLYMYDILECIADDEFPSYLPLMKQNIDLWMGAGNKSHYEREFMQMIMRENTAMRWMMCMLRGRLRWDLVYTPTERRNLKNSMKAYRFKVRIVC